MKAVAQGLWPQNRQQLVLLCGGCFQQVHRPKSARIVEGDAGAIVHVKDNMVMFLRLRVVVHKLTQRITRHGHASGHAKMNEQRLAAVQIRKDVFRPPPQRIDTPPAEPFGHAIGERPAQIRAVHCCLCYDGPFHRG